MSSLPSASAREGHSVNVAFFRKRVFADVIIRWASWEGRSTLNHMGGGAAATCYHMEEGSKQRWQTGQKSTCRDQSDKATREGKLAGTQSCHRQGKDSLLEGNHHHHHVYYGLPNTDFGHLVPGTDKSLSFKATKSVVIHHSSHRKLTQQVQWTPEQHGFELHGSVCARIFLQ